MLMKDKVIEQLHERDRGANRELTITTETLINALAEYEVDTERRYGSTVEELDEQTGYDEDIITGNSKLLKYRDCFNSYNNGCSVVFQYYSYDLADTSDVVIIMSFHIDGDVRANYTDPMVFQFSSFEEFYEILIDEAGGDTSFDVNGKHVYIHQSILDEDGCVRVDVYTEDGEMTDTYEVYIPFEYGEKDYKEAFVKIITDKDYWGYDNYAEIREILGIK